LSESLESPFKAFGKVVSQIAQGKTFEEIFPPIVVPFEDDSDESGSLSGVDPTLQEILADEEGITEQTTAG